MIEHLHGADSFYIKHIKLEGLLEIILFLSLHKRKLRQRTAFRIELACHSWTTAILGHWTVCISYLWLHGKLF